MTPGSFQYLAFVLAGLALCALGGLRIAYALADRPPRIEAFLSAQLVSAQLVADGLLGSAALGLVAAFVYITFIARGGRVLPPGSYPSGFWLGLCGVVFVTLAFARLAALPRLLVVGMALGVLAALVVFRVVFGPTAGFGHELGHGVGAEVAVALGVVLGLLGALLGALAERLRGRRRVLPGQAMPRALAPHLLGAMVVGLAAGAVLAVVGTDLGLVRFPYVAEIMYISDTSMPGGWVRGLEYGLVLLGAIGVLLGGLAVLLSRPGLLSSSLTTSVGLALSLACGLLSGLSVGFLRRYVGGPLILPMPVNDPVAGMRGLVTGIILGVAVAVALAVTALLYPRFADRLPPRVQQIAGGLALILPGVLALTLPLWFTPLVDIY